MKPQTVSTPRRSGGALAASLSVAIMAALGFVLTLFQGPSRPGATVIAPLAFPAVMQPRPEPPAPAALQARLDEIAAAFGQPLGIAVMDVDRGWMAGVDRDGIYPQQSVSKLWVALSVLDAVDRGELSLDQQLLLTDDDRSVFFQPLTIRIRAGGYPVTIRELLGHALSESDNAANDKLMAQVGGPHGVSRILAKKDLTDLRVGASERDLQAGIAGMSWSPEYGHGRVFQQMREKLPDWRRDEALAAYLAQPPDGVSPAATARALAALKQGRLLSPRSTTAMLEMMAAARTGPRRLKGGLPPGWSIAHKTGTGPDWRGASVGINDVALITAPDGRAYAAAAMMRNTSRSVPERLETMQQITRAIAASWRAEQGEAKARPHPVLQQPPGRIPATSDAQDQRPIGDAKAGKRLSPVRRPATES